MSEDKTKAVLAEPLRELKERCLNHLARLFPTTLPKTLYHYTDTPGFMGIVSKHELWATRIEFLNDSYELSYSIGVLKERFEHFRKQKGEDSEESKLLDYLEPHCDFIRTYFNIFAISFSSKFDDLSQWRGYSGGLGGYLIGFDFTMMDIAMSSIFKRKKGDPRLMVEIDYDRDKHVENFDYLIKEMLELFSSRIRGIDPASGLRDHLCQQIIVILSDYLIRFKNPVFRGEEEWRLVILKDDFVSLIDYPVDYRASRFGLVPYVTFKNNAAKGQLPVAKVVQGPRAEPELSRRAVYEFLGRHGYPFFEEEICLSKVPLRY